MFCNKCGGRVTDGARFCNKCGNTMGVNAAASDEPPVMNQPFVQAATAGAAGTVPPAKTKGKRAHITIVTATVVVVALVLSFAIWQQNELDEIESRLAGFSHSLMQGESENAVKYCVPSGGAMDSLATDFIEFTKNAVIHLMDVEEIPREEVNETFRSLVDLTFSVSRSRFAWSGGEAEIYAEVRMSIGDLYVERHDYIIKMVQLNGIWYIKSIKR